MSVRFCLPTASALPASSRYSHKNILMRMTTILHLLFLTDTQPWPPAHGSRPQCKPSPSVTRLDIMWSPFCPPHSMSSPPPPLCYPQTLWAPKSSLLLAPPGIFWHRWMRAKVFRSVCRCPCADGTSPALLATNMPLSCCRARPR